jgi:ketosteroid isomerase-like protein
MSKDNIATIRGAYDSFARRDFAHMPFDAQIEWIEPEVEGSPVSGTHRGPEAVVKEVFEPALERLDEFRLRCDQYLPSGDKVVVTGCFLGRGTETGNELNAPFAHIWTLRNEKVVSFQNYTDTANWLHALYKVHIDQPIGAHA